MQHVLNDVSQTNLINLWKNKTKLSHKATSWASYGIADVQLMELFCITSNQKMNSECKLATLCYVWKSFIPNSQKKVSRFQQLLATLLCGQKYRLAVMGCTKAEIVFIFLIPCISLIHYY